MVANVLASVTRALDAQSPNNLDDDDDDNSGEFVSLNSSSVHTLETA